MLNQVVSKALTRPGSPSWQEWPDAPEKGDGVTTAAATVAFLPTERLSANDYNPNHMSDEAFWVTTGNNGPQPLTG